jgi:hypothetical protein
MSPHTRPLLLVLLFYSIFSTVAVAQHYDASGRIDESDREILQSTLESVRETVAEVLSWVGDQVGSAGSWVEDRVNSMHRARTLADIKRSVHDIEIEVRRMEAEAISRGEKRVARELGRMEKQLANVKKEIDRAERKVNRQASQIRVDVSEKMRRMTRRSNRYDWRSASHWYPGHSRYGYGIDPFGGHIATMFGAQPFYPALPGLRYNRVDGFVLGIDVEPIRFTSSRRSKVYGQVGYAFGLDDIRYHVGFETRIGDTRWHRSDLGFTLGASYHENTLSDDTWKIDQWENALAAFFFRNDFLDYYESEGWNVYVSKYVRSVDALLRVGYRSSDHRSLTNNTNWSLFRDSDFRLNPPIIDGRMNELVVEIEAGDFYQFARHPKGGAFRATAELGADFGGDFSFNRYIADGRFFTPLGRATGLSVRGRGGYGTASTPLQRVFTIGGAGTVRAYPQNEYYGRRMLLGNAELAFSQVDLLLTDAQLFGFVDAGWVGDDFDQFDFDDAFYAAGAGIALDDRHIRFEIAWPVNDSIRSEPTIWFRLNPTF